MPAAPAIYVLTGCTAVGKTELALQWAESSEAEIVSCDSLLFYRGMDIGTAKPTRDELARVPHHLIDLCEPSQSMDIARYLTLAKGVVADITARGKPVLVTGGSGFYLKAFIGPVVDAVQVSAELRARVAGLAMSEALAELRQLNPDGLGALDVANPRRVTRALERCLASGRTMAALLEEFLKQPSPFADYEVRLVELAREPTELATRIMTRVRAMLEQGLVKEVEHLLTAGLINNPSGANAIGYREVRAMLAGDLPAEAVAEEITKNTRALVKKQRTWFRNQLPAHPVLPAAEVQAHELFASWR